MAERIFAREWTLENSTTRYPFAETATLVSDDGRLIVDGLFLDAAIHPIGGAAGLYMSSVVIDFQTVRILIGNDSNPALCSGSFDLIAPPDAFALVDANGLPAGLIVSESLRLAVFQSWGIGTHALTRAQAEFCATVCVPTPEIGVRGILLDDGTLLTKDVWLVGSAGVVFTATTVTLPATCAAPAVDVPVIRLDVVGDPLFRRNLCTPVSLFETPQFITQVTFVDPFGNSFVCAPDENGDLRILVGNTAAVDTVLRVTATPDGIEIGAVGAATQA